MTFTPVIAFLARNKWLLVAVAVAFTAFQARLAYVARQVYEHPATKTAEAVAEKRNVTTVTHVIYRADGTKAEETVTAADKTVKESAKTAESTPVPVKTDAFLSLGPRVSYSLSGAPGAGLFAEVGIFRAGATVTLKDLLDPTFTLDARVWSWH